MRPSYHAKPYVSDARTVAVPTCEAEINRPTDGERKKIRIRKQGRRQHLGEYIQSGDRCRVAHQGQFYKFLDRAAPELYPDLLILVSGFLCCRVRRPFDTQMPEVVETYADRTVALIVGRIQIHAQARDRSLFDCSGGAGCESSQALVRDRQLPCQELAFSSI